MRSCVWLALPLMLAFGCERAHVEGATASAAASALLDAVPRPRASQSPVTSGSPVEQIEIRACAPLEDGELRLLDVDAHTAARLIAIARRTPVVAAGRPERGCAGRCRSLVLTGPAEADLSAVGFEVTRTDGLLLAGPAKLPVRRLLDGGPKIDIERERAAFSELALALAGDERLDRQMAARLEGELTVVARNVSSHRLLDAAAALAGGRLRKSGGRAALDGVRGVQAIGRRELANCAAPVCPVVVARCSDTRMLRLVAVMRRPFLRPVPQPLELGEGIKDRDTSAFVADEGGFAWHVRVGDHIGRAEPGASRDGDETRRVEAITCGTVTLDDGTTIRPAG